MRRDVWGMKIEGPQVTVPEAFVYYVRLSRKLQQQFFDGDKGVLHEAKRAEQAVDFFLRQMPDIGKLEKDPQEVLF